MEKVLSYKFKDMEYLINKGEGLANIVKDWLKNQGIDALVYTFILGDIGSFIVDYSFDEVVTEKKVKHETELILNRFNIEFELDEYEDEV